MGLLDNLKNVLGGKKDASITAGTKAPSQVLKENGIDPSGLKFAFGSDGTITVSGQVKQESDKARIKQILTGIPGIKQVKQELVVATVEAPKPAESPAESPLPGPAASPSSESSPAQPADASHTATSYTVQPGDTLWKISKQFYGEGSKYMKIFEANQGILKNPDHILPGQKLVIPEK